MTKKTKREIAKRRADAELKKKVEARIRALETAVRLIEIRREKWGSSL